MNTKLILFAILCICIAAPVLGASEARLTQKRSAADLKCELCEFVVGWIENQLRNGTEEHRIAEEIGFLCNILPWPLGETCIWGVQQFVSVVINLIEDALPPSRICYIVNMCQSLQSFLPNINVTEMPCARCLFYTAWARLRVVGVTNPTEALSRLQFACNALQDPAARNDCTAFISQPNMSAKLISKLPAEQLCTQFGRCKSIA